MNEHYQEQVKAVRELATVFIDQISELSFSQETGSKINPRVAELQRELAESTPDLVTIRDLIVLIKDLIDEVPKIWLN